MVKNPTKYIIKKSIEEMVNIPSHIFVDFFIKKHFITVNSINKQLQQRYITKYINQQL